MNENLFRELLQEIAEQEIADDMNLWPEIQTQLKAPVSRRARSSLRLARVAAALAILLLVSAAVYAVYQELLTGDNGLEAVNQENLVTQLDMIQVVDGITVTLEWAYADANRIVVAFNAEGTAKAEDNVSTFNFYETTLTDDQGHEFVGLNGSGGGGGGGGGGSAGGMISFGAGLQAHYDASIIEDTPETLNLRLDTSFGITYADNSPVTPSRATFEFSIPFNPGTTINTEATASASGVDMTLHKVVIAPSLTRLELCHNAPPPDNSDWVIYGSLTVDGKEIVPETQLSAQPVESAEAGVTCWSLNLPEALDEQPGDWTLTIPALRIVGSEDRQTVADILARDYSIRVTVEPTGGYSYDTPPDDPENGRETVAATRAAVIQDNLEAINGPWVFNFNVTDQPNSSS